MNKLMFYKGKAMACLILICLTIGTSILNSCKKDRLSKSVSAELTQSEVNEAFNSIVKNSEYLIGDKNAQLDWSFVERIDKYGNNYVRYKLANNQEIVFVRNSDIVKAYLNHTSEYKDEKDNLFTFVLSTDLQTSKTYVATFYQNIRVAFLPIEDVLETMNRHEMQLASLNIKSNPKNKIALSFPKEKLFASASLWEHIKCWIKFSVYRENGPDGPGCYWLDFAGIWDAVKELLNSDPDDSGSNINTVSIQPILNWGDATGLPDYGPPNSNNPQTPLPDNGNGPGVVDTGLSQYPPNQWDAAVAGQAPITTEVSQLVSGFNLERFYQEYLRYHDNAIATTLLNYTNANGGFTTDNGEFAKWAIDYLSENSDVSLNSFQNQFMPAVQIIADPNTDNWSDPDNEVLTDLDQTVYQQYQDNQPWPTVDRKDVIPFEKFVPVRLITRLDGTKYTVNCLILAKEQLAKAGYTCSGYLPGSQTFQTYTESNGVDLAETKKAISYIISSLRNKIPILIGVDNRVGTPSIKNVDGSTDHFIVIVAMGTDTKGKYLQFIDNATNNISYGASFSNRLYYNSNTGKLTGKTAIEGYRNQSGMHDYIVTQVRKSIKK